MSKLEPTGVPSRQAIQDAIDSAIPQAGNTVVFTNAVGEAQFSYPVPFPDGTDVVVVAAGGNEEDVYVFPGSITATGFTARFRTRNANHTPIANGPVRIYWIAMKRTES